MVSGSRKSGRGASRSTALSVPPENQHRQRDAARLLLEDQILDEARAGEDRGAERAGGHAQALDPPQTWPYFSSASASVRPAARSERMATSVCVSFSACSNT